MHATVYQIAKEPIKEEDYITENDLPDWFWAKMDYADVVEEPYATKRCVCTGGRAGLHFDPDKRLLTVTDKTAYFRDKYDSFRNHAAKLADCTLEEFVMGGPRMSMSVYCVQQTYNDEYDLYVYDEEGVLETFDEWVRYGGESAYIGAVLDYHY